jgi:hypothetical protein
MVFRNVPGLAYRHVDQREVELGMPGRILDEGWVRHYGKALSVARWERKCDYYAQHFPRYAAKWQARRGAAIHTHSDFGRPLIAWAERDARGVLMPLETACPDGGGPATLRILWTSHHLMDFAGTETYTLTVVGRLIERGHRVTVYSKFVEPLRAALSTLGAEIVDDLAQVRQRIFDVAHVQHNIGAYEVRDVFGELPLVFVAHGVLPFLEGAPVVDLGISRFLAVSEEVADRLRQQPDIADRVHLCRNLVDERQFRPRGPAAERPQRAVVLSNRIDGEAEAAIRGACAAMRIDVLFVGARFTTVPYGDLPWLLSAADVVFTLGRGAMEAMLCGRVPFVMDRDGADGLITPDVMPESMRCNFSGRARRLRLDSGGVQRELARYDSRQGPVLRELALRHFGAVERCAELEAHYRAAIEDRPLRRAAALAHAVAATVAAAVRETLGQAGNLERRRAARTTQPLPINGQARRLLAASLAERGWLEPARGLLEQALVEAPRRSPEESTTLVALAQLDVGAERFREALVALQRALAFDPQNAAARQTLARLEAQVQARAFRAS